MSINKAHALALADGFVESYGSNEELQPRETISELFLLAGEFVEDAQDNLNKTNSNASGGLSASLILDEPTETGNTVKVNVMMDYYGQFVNSGVKGTKSGQGKYQFRSPFPSTKMVNALKKSINRAKKSTTNVNRHKSTSRNEIKNASISDIDKAYGAGRNIKMYGIKANGFIDKAVATTTNKIEDRLSKAFEIDILNSLTGEKWQ